MSHLWFPTVKPPAYPYQARNNDNYGNCGDSEWTRGGTEYRIHIGILTRAYRLALMNLRTLAWVSSLYQASWITRLTAMRRCEPSSGLGRKLGFPRPLPWRWWRHAEPVTKRRLWRLYLRMFIPFGLIFVVMAFLPLSPKTSTTNFVLAILMIVLWIMTLVMTLRSLKQVVRLTDQIHAEVAAKKEQSS